MGDMIPFHSTRMTFHSRRGHLRTRKASKHLAAGAAPPQTPLRKVALGPDPIAGSLPSPKPARWVLPLDPGGAPPLEPRYSRL